MPNLELRQLLRYNLFYWLALATFDSLHTTVHFLLPGHYEFQLPYVINRTLLFLLEILLSNYFIRWSFSRQLTQSRVVLAAVLLLCVYTPLSNLGQILIKDLDDCVDCVATAWWLLSQLDTTSLPLFIWVMCYLTFWRHQQQQQQLHATAQLHQNIQQLELQALQHQLNPHFTFNALNSLCALLEAQRYDDAEQMSEQLATFLRYSLSKSPQSLVMLADELAAVEAYLALQKIRFGDKLKVVWQIDASLKTQRIPALLLQPLVENAVKYAVASRSKGATVRIEGRRQQTHLQLTVQDDGPGSSLHKDCINGSGVGLSNIKSRLQQHFGDQASLEILAQPTGFQVNIRLPWQHIAG